MTRVLIWTLLLSLIVWVIFYSLGWPLQKSETAVVTGSCLLLVLAVDRVVRSLRNRKIQLKPTKPKIVGRAKRSRIVKCLLLVVLSSASAGLASTDLHLCGTDRPSAGPNDIVKLSYLGDQIDSKSMRYKWSVPAGRTTGDGSDVDWVLKDVPEGKYIATLNVNQANGDSAICFVHIYVIQPYRGTTSRGLLVRGRQVPPGYGLYTYLLFASPPDENSRERYLKAIETYIRLNPSLEQMIGVVDKNVINLNCLPVDSSPLEDVDPEWVLKHYDYATARALLASVDGIYLAGPYLLSGSYIGQDQRLLSKPLLFQNLSVVPPNLVTAWYEHFLNEAAQQDTLAVTRVQDLALRVRTLIGVLAIALPDVQGEMDKWVKFFR